MKVFHQGFARGKRGAAVGVLAASMLASALGMAPSAQALPLGFYEVGCGNELGLALAIGGSNNDGVPSQINIKGSNCKFDYDQSYDTAGSGDNALPTIEGDGALVIWGHGAKVSRKSSAPAFRLLEVGPGSDPVTVNDMTFSGGKLEEFASQPAGGGVLVNFATSGATFNRVTIKDNSVKSFHIGLGLVAGGGLANLSDDLTLYKTTVTGNKAVGSGALLGIGVAIGGGVANTGNGFTMTSSTLSKNTAESVGNAASATVGGGLGTTGEIASVSKSTVSGNKAKTTGGGLLQGALGGGVGSINDIFAFADSTVSDNTAECNGDGCFAAGGGVAAAGPTNTFTKTTIKGNTAKANDGIAAGGGIALGASDLTLTDSTVTKNTAKGAIAVGGGIAADPSIVGLIDLDDSVITKNKPENCYGVFGAC